MDLEIPSSQTSPVGSGTPKSTSSTLDLSDIPPVHVLPSHFKDDEEHEVKEILRQHGAQLTSDISKVKVFIGKVGTKKRAEFELRSRQLKVEELVTAKRVDSLVSEGEPPIKRRKIEGSAAKPIHILDDQDAGTSDAETIDNSETEDEGAPKTSEMPLMPPSSPAREVELVPEPIFESPTNDDIVWVVKLDWLNECVAAGHLLPLGDHLVYKGKVHERPEPSKPRRSIRHVAQAPTLESVPNSQSVVAAQPQLAQSVLERAKEDASDTPSKSTYRPHRRTGHGTHHFEGRSFAPNPQSASRLGFKASQLLQQTTSEYESEDSEIPPPPAWVARGIKYACQRFTPPNPPNQEFIEQLKKIRTARILIDDEIGVRAYSTIIASIAAYPYKLIHPREIRRLPGCDHKVELLWIEWKNTGKIQAVEDFEDDEAMKVLRSFYDIWGVGAKTARHFYYDNHWTELDDIVEFGWNDLDRVQQIGVKYYDEFLEGIPRAEVEQIAAVVKEHAVRLRDDQVTVTVVGGYRRGKEKSGDVDMIVSHPDLEATAGLVREIVESLEDAEWITHTLTMSLNSTHRGQSTLPFRTSKASGVGFDTLDKALVVWQDPSWPTREADLLADPRAKNPNIHRRVDIIVSPWRTVGCAVMGWSGGTTFQRDLRRYAKHAKGWKFDSSGVRSRVTGEVIEIEGAYGVEGSPEDAERTVFKGMGLEYVPPEMRCTN